MTFSFPLMKQKETSYLQLLDFIKDFYIYYQFFKQVSLIDKASRYCVPGFQPGHTRYPAKGAE